MTKMEFAQQLMLMRARGAIAQQGCIAEVRHVADMVSGLWAEAEEREWISTKSGWVVDKDRGVEVHVG